MEYQDYYATLGVPRTASQAEIKKAYRKLARQSHPDVNKGDAAAERRFKAVNEAHAVLGDPEKRKAYDALGADWQAYQHQAQAGGPFATGGPFASSGAPGQGVRFEFRGDPQDLAGFSDFFRTFFAAGPAPGASVAGEGARRRGTATTAEGMDFSDLLAGLGLDASSRVRHGASTQGPGAAPARRPEARVRVEVSLEEAYHGTKRLVQVDGKRLEVTIPRGVATGSRIRLSGQAGSGPQGGDVILEVAVREHPVFARRGDDLQRELPITLAEALLGGEVPVPTLKGRVLLRIPPETQSGRSFRLKGQGMPRFRKEGFGDLLVKVRVVLPSGLDAEGRSRLKAFLDHHPQPDPRRTTPGDHDA